MEDNYEKYWTRPKDFLLSEVLDRTIEIDYMINGIVRDYFNLGIKFDKDNRIINLDKIASFSDFFFLDLGASKKLKLLKKAREDLSEDEITDVEKLGNKFLRVYEIRNIFAHSKLPKETDKKWLAEPEKVSWEELADEHKELCEELTLILLADFGHGAKRV